MIRPAKKSSLPGKTLNLDYSKNIFNAVEEIQKRFRSFIEYHMNISNPTIQNAISNQIEHRQYLFQPPIIELDPIFLNGPPNVSVAKELKLHPKIMEFYGAWDWWAHQTEAIEKVIGKEKNVIVTTGTGSGKSLTFVLPIINYCLKMQEAGKKGVKALIVYPMNALANSQYKKIAKLLDNSDLRVCLYTSKLPNKTPSLSDPSKQENAKKKIFTCEVLSRADAQDNPPDILITNYSMLEYIMDRHDDHRIFPQVYKKYFKYIVLDEIHTYEGSLGSHVAHLIRRFKYEVLKDEANPQKITCIGTSATIDNTIDKILENAGEVVSQENASQNPKSGKEPEIIHFAKKIFDEPFDEDSIVTAQYYDLVADMKLQPLPTKITLQPEDIENFSGEIGPIFNLMAKIFGDQIRSQPQTPENLGLLLMQHPAMAFLYETLKANPMKITELEDLYYEKVRKVTQLEKELSDLELRAIILASSKAKVKIYGKLRDLALFRIHQFYNKGNPVYACLTKNDYHLQFTGETSCSECDKTGKKRSTFPLVFCNNCGNEFALASLKPIELGVDKRKYEVRPVFNIYSSTSDEVLKSAYICKVINEEEAIPDRVNAYYEPPEEWFFKRDKSKLLAAFIDKVPKKMRFCPECNILSDLDEEEFCPHDDLCVEVWVNFDDFKICPYCETDYSDVAQDTSKLYSPLYTGRSTPVDVLTISALNSFAANQQKMLLFTDNRQDSAFQSAHLNDFYQKIMIRHALYAIVKEQTAKGESVTVRNIGKLMHHHFNALNLDFLARQDPNNSVLTSELNELYLNYYTFLALSDNLLGTYRLNPNLERLGLIEVFYDNFDDFVGDPVWKNPSLYFKEHTSENESFLTPESEKILQSFDADLIYDLGITLLNFMRSRGAVDHDLLRNTKTYWNEWLKKLNQKAIFDNPYFRFKDQNHYFTDNEDFDANRLLLDVRVDAKQFFSKTSYIFKATKKFLGDTDLLRDLKGNCSKEQWDSLCMAIHRFFLNILFSKGYISSDTLYGKNRTNYTVYLLNPSKFLYTLARPSIKCPKCKRLYQYKSHRYCIQGRCVSKLRTLENETNFFKHLYQQSTILTHPLIAAEHTAQIDLKERGDIEDSFEEHQPGSINVIVCTPTMELGVDIGNLPLVFLRNVPPTSSSYAQRAGRAGRDQNNSIVLTFCNFNLYSNSGAHDNYFYHNPEKIVSGKIIPPKFNLDSRKIMKMHIHGIIMRHVSQHISGKLSEMIDFENKPLYPVKMDRLQNIKKAILDNYQNIIRSIQNAYRVQEFVKEYPWFTDAFILEHIDGFMNNLQITFDIVRAEFKTLTEERDELYRITDRKGADKGSLEYTRMRQIQKILDEIQNRDFDKEEKGGYSRYNTWNFLRNNGFIPNYGFPEENLKVQLWNLNQNSRPIENFRNPVVALREFAPLAKMYIKGMVYLVNYADYRYKNNLTAKSLYLCKKCNYIEHSQQNIANLQKCNNCGEEVSPSNFKEALEFPSMRGYSREIITSQQENREPGNYEIIYNYHPSKMVKTCELFRRENNAEIPLGTVKFDSDGLIFALNHGRFNISAQKYETFNICVNCQKWLTTDEVTDDKIAKHISVSPAQDFWKKGCRKDDIKKDQWLFLTHRYNVFTLNVPRTIFQGIYEKEVSGKPLEPLDFESFYVTLKNLVQQTIEHIFCLSESDILSFLTKGKNDEYEIVIYETEDGGSGYLKLLIDEHKWFRLFTQKLPEIIHFIIDQGKIAVDHSKKFEEGCIDACYECLKNYRNQFEHELLDRHIVKPFLNQLLSASLKRKEEIAPSIDFHEEDFDSGLEKLFIAKLKELNIKGPDKPKEVIIDPQTKAPFTNVDFFYAPKLCVYVDGPPHDPEKYPEQAKKDAVITDNLELMGYYVFRIKLYKMEAASTDILPQLRKLKDILEKL